MHHWIAFLVLLIASFSQAEKLAGQQVAIDNFTLDNFGRPLVTVASDIDHYYTLYAKNANETTYHAVSMSLGSPDSLILSESLVALPQNAYQVQARLVTSPGDEDKDGIDDVTELLDIPNSSPLNPAQSVITLDGEIRLETSPNFSRLARAATTGDSTNQGELYAVSKIYLVNNVSTDSIQGYFVNTNEHEFHLDFARAVGIPTKPNGVSLTEDMRGTIIYHPEIIAANGTRGLYSFRFGFSNAYPFEIIQRAYDLIAINMPFLKGNLAFRPRFQVTVDKYEEERSLYDASRVSVVSEEELFAGLDYLALNEEIGFGRLQILEPNVSPSPFDIVMSESVPDDLPRVAGILTGSVQTPLAHVNLRAIQDGIPNAYIRDVFTHPEIQPLIGEYVKLTIANEGFEIRLATRAEVDDHFASIRPDSIQVLSADLSKTEILSLDALDFADVISVGAKAANLGQLTTLPFDAGTLPEGYAIPFYFYDRFMEHNGLYDEAAAFLSDPSFRQNLSQQDQALEDFRRKIEFGIMPTDLFDELTILQAKFPSDSFVRCRSSSNNEDLPGFSGAGLYDSKTHRPDEGHLIKTVRQVFAGLWTYRAFVERDFYRINHLSAKMGVLVHLSYKNELSNGVGVSIDPLYGSEGQYYLNTQLGNELVTNPDGTVSPEELLITEDNEGSELRYELVRQSNLVPIGVQLMDSFQLVKTRDYLKLIHEMFAPLYAAEDLPDFAMEIEYKVNENNQFIIKQARPWVGFSRTVIEPIDTNIVIPDELTLGAVYPNPTRNTLAFPLFSDKNYEKASLQLYSPLGQLMFEQEWLDIKAGEDFLFTILPFLTSGTYFFQLDIKEAKSFNGKVVVE
ncbi:MAG: PEP/pyruvate-binding domain-containing protein [Saprospiraceae bacterium]